MKNNYFCLNKSYDKEFIYHATFTNNKSISFDNIFVVEKYMCKKYPQFTGIIRALLTNFQNIFWNPTDNEIYYVNEFNIKKQINIKDWEKFERSGNQTKDYINIMKSFGHSFEDIEVNTKQDFLENIKNLQSILKQC